MHRLKNVFVFSPNDSVRVGWVTDDQDLDGLLGDLVDGASLNLKLIRTIFILRVIQIPVNEEGAIDMIRLIFI